MLPPLSDGRRWKLDSYQHPLLYSHHQSAVDSSIMDWCISDPRKCASLACFLSPINIGDRRCFQSRKRVVWCAHHVGLHARFRANSRNSP